PRMRQVGAGQGSCSSVLDEFSGRALEDDLATVLTGTRSEIDDVVCRPNRLFIMLHDDDRVAEIAKPGQGAEQFPVIALVQSDRRFVEDVKHPGQIGATLRGQPDALSLAARERRGTPSKCEIADADIVKKSQPILDFTKNAFGNDRFAIGQLEAFENLQRFRDRQVHIFGNRSDLDPHGKAFGLQPLAATGWTWP